jgi:hypothetical protein
VAVAIVVAEAEAEAIAWAVPFAAAVAEWMGVAVR